MPASSSSADKQRPFSEVLHHHLPGLYRLAQLLAVDTSKAAALVKETYRRALELPAEERARLKSRTELYRFLFAVHAERSGEEATSRLPSSGTPHPNLNVLHSRIAQQYVEKALPLALISLPPSQQLLLLLHAVDQMPPTEAGHALGLDPEEARHELTAAQTALLEQTLAQVSRPVQQILRPHFPEDGGMALLRHLFQNHLASVPSSLRTAVSDLSPDQDAASPRSNVFSTPHSSPQELGTDQQYVTLRRYLKYTAIILLLIFVGALARLLFQNTQQQEVAAPQDLLTLSIQQAPTLQPALRTSSPEAARTFIQRNLERQATIPAIEDASLAGVGLDEVAPGIEVPVLFYDDAQAGTFPVYVYSYALLNRFSERIHLAKDLLNHLAEESTPAAREPGDRTALVWRNRATIYVAVPAKEAGALRQRISSSS